MKILRSIICALLLCALALTFAACSEDKPEDTSAQTTSAPEKDGSVYVEYKGTRIVMGADADGIIKSLGEPSSKKEIGDCGGLGAQVKYSYASFEIYVLESKTEGNKIDQITFRDDLIATPEGVCIGQTVSDVKKALGEPARSDGKSMEYTKGAFILSIGIDGDTVTAIDYMTISN